MAKHASSSEQQSVRVLKVGERVRHILSELLARGEAHDDVLSASNIAVTVPDFLPLALLLVDNVLLLKGGAAIMAVDWDLRRQVSPLGKLVQPS